MGTQSIAGLAVLAVLLALPGFVTYFALLTPARGRGRPQRIEALYLVLLISLLLVGWMALMLADVGLYSLGALSVLVVAYSAVLAAIRRSHLSAALSVDRLAISRSFFSTGNLRASAYHICLGVALLGAVALFFHPHEMVRGGLDAGVYVNTGANIAKTGSVVYRDPLIASLTKEETDELFLKQAQPRHPVPYLRMAGFYIQDQAAGLVQPQFYHLYPSLLAVAFSAVGVEWGLNMTPYLGLLGALGLFLLANRLFGRWVGLLSLSLLVVSGTQIWFSRYPNSEIVVQVLMLGALFCLAAATDAWNSGHKTRATVMAIVAGAAMGATALARADFIFTLVPLVLYLVFLRLSRKWESPHTYFLLGLAVVLVHAGLHIAFRSNLYTADLFYHVIKNVMNQIQWVIPGAVIGIAGLVVLDRYADRINLLGMLNRWRRPVLLALCVVVGAYGIYTYLVRPGIIDFTALGRYLSHPSELTGYIGAPVPMGAAANLVRLGWYVSPLGILVGLAGILLCLYKLSARTLLFIGLYLIFVFVFIDQTYTEPYYIYSMRRYVPLVIPGLFVLTSYAIVRLAGVRRLQVAARVGAAAIAALMLIFFAYTDRVIAGHVEYQGAISQIQDLARTFDSRSVVIFSGERDQPYVVATPLEYLFGQDVFALRRSAPLSDVVEGLVKRLEAQGRNVYLVLGTNGGRLDMPGMDLVEVREWQLKTRELEQLRDQKPTNTYENSMWLGVYRPADKASDPPSDAPFAIDVGGFDYQYLVSGFMEKEQGPGDESYRWAGPNATLRLPWHGNGSAVLTLRMSSGPDTRDSAATVKVLAGKQVLGKLNVVKGFHDYQVEVPEDVVAAAGGELTLALSSTYWRPADSIPGSKDTRQLGVQLDRLELTVAQ